MTKKKTFMDLSATEKAYYLCRYFKYEVDMFKLAYHKERLTHAKGLAGIIEHNIALECFLLHARNLRDFLIKNDNSRQQDALARHFVDSTKWELIEKRAKKESKEIYDNLNYAIGKHVAHLTYIRPLKNCEDQLWDVDEIFNFIMKLVNEFDVFKTTNQQSIKEKS